jgi:hypothetical protein
MKSKFIASSTIFCPKGYVRKENFNQQYNFLDEGSELFDESIWNI